MPRNYINCQECGRSFYSTAGKVKCKCCLEISPEKLKRRAIRYLKTNCDDVFTHEKEIKLLATKMKWGLLNPIDKFRICHVYLAVTCNESKYSTYDVDGQCELMIIDLIQMLEQGIELNPEKNNVPLPVVRVSPVTGKVVEEYKSIAEAAEKNEVYKGFVSRSCNGNHKKSHRLRFRWKKDI